MEIKVLNWNIGGAKVLEQKCMTLRAKVRDEINRDIQTLLRKHTPDIVTLQEVVAYKQPSDNEMSNIIDKRGIDRLGYKCFFFPLIDSLGFSSQDKWVKIKNGKCCDRDCTSRHDQCPGSDLKGSDWHKDSYFAQGNGMLFRKDAPLFPCCDLSRPGEVSPGQRLLTIIEQQKVNPVSDIEREIANDYQNYLAEKTPLTRGSYFGDRDTEPRAAIVSDLIYGSPLHGDSRPIDIFVVNVHLTTIMKERVGIPSKDTEASRLRIDQLTAMFDEIISRFNSWYEDGFPQRGVKRTLADCHEWETIERHHPVWLLCGDFNFTESSREHDFVLRRNFIDTTPPGRRTRTLMTNQRRHVSHTGTKTSGAGNPATLTLDYIFAGPKFVALDPLFTENEMLDNMVDYTVCSSDHYPIVSKIPLAMVR
jgi:endonuclease/exonuclease/phosphatase family metal-dependent hydrolase